MPIIEVTLNRTGATVLTVRGNLDCGAGEDELKQTLRILAKRCCFRCVVNLREVPHLDTTCLGALIAAHAEFQKHGGGVRLVRTPERIRHVLSIAKLDQVLLTFASEADAIQDFASAAAPSAT